jgi:SAM-dependent methyltransferase
MGRDATGSRTPVRRLATTLPARLAAAHGMTRIHPKRLVRRSGWLRMPRENSGEFAVKPASYTAVYEELLAPYRRRRFALLELGLWKGDSLQMWQAGFPRATIVGIDLDPPAVDLGKRVRVERGDAADPALLRAVREKHAPGGFDVIIDDASHEALPTAASLAHLFVDHLRPGGTYIIEDWATGYLAGFADGAAPAASVDVSELGSAMDTRLPSHDHGMVGLVKRLVEHVAAPTIASYDPGTVGRPLPIESIVIRDGLVALRRADA